MASGLAVLEEAVEAVARMAAEGTTLPSAILRRSRGRRGYRRVSVMTTTPTVTAPTPSHCRGLMRSPMAVGDERGHDRELRRQHGRDGDRFAGAPGVGVDAGHLGEAGEDDERAAGRAGSAAGASATSGRVRKATPTMRPAATTQLAGTPSLARPEA